MPWILIDIAVVVLALLVLVGLSLGLWKRIKSTKGDVVVLSDLAAQASDAVATIQR